MGGVPAIAVGLVKTVHTSEQSGSGCPERSEPGKIKSF